MTEKEIDADESVENPESDRDVSGDSDLDDGGVSNTGYDVPESGEDFDVAENPERLYKSFTNDTEIGHPYRSKTLTEESSPRRQEDSISTEGLSNPSSVQNPDEINPYIESKSGDGSTSEEDDYVTEVGLDDGDGRCKMETYFDPNRASDGKRRLYERLYRLQQGQRVNDDDRSIRNRAADRRRDVLTWTSQLRMGKQSQERVIEILEEGKGDLTPADEETCTDEDVESEDTQVSDGVTLQGRKFEPVALAVISIVANENGRRVRREEDWKSIQDSLNVASGDVRRFRGVVKRESSYL